MKTTRLGFGFGLAGERETFPKGKAGFINIRRVVVYATIHNPRDGLIQSGMAWQGRIFSKLSKIKMQNAECKKQKVMQCNALRYGSLTARLYY
jgi:hypothetical protein